MGPMWNAGFYALLMVATLLGVLTIEGVFSIEMPNEAWALIGLVIGKVGDGFKSTIEANIKLKEIESNVPILTDRNTGSTE